MNPQKSPRGVTATWWYTASAIVFFELMVVLLWSLTLLQGRFDPAVQLLVLALGLVWIASTLPLLRAYRHRSGETTHLPWRSILVPVLVAAAYGGLTVAVTGLWQILLLPVAQSLQLLDWPKSVRLRLVLVLTVLLGCLWVVDANTGFTRPPLDEVADTFVLGFFSASLPLITVLSLWWWDVLIALDRARVSEARLAATQERLSVATDVHDLQGHHLQVIALQLELAERLLASDPDAALEQLRAARVSVDEARQGTRDLATRFRSVPLGDELANAGDLLRAAGLAVKTTVAPGTDAAPAALFGPVIRETTTNVLRHGGGRSATLSLGLDAGQWRYEISNDVSTGIGARDPAVSEGSGLDGIARRAAEAGGSMQVHSDGRRFAVLVTAPAVGGAGR
ncbi:sensor histidine kinase [Herbiconiux sp. A18JL235]|uniref:histidine kinase n=1 Tax=Herbiconiux sp. A18JL235 TaxID=3152363 RepID=A0AB39BMP4_9MICO